MRKIIVREKHLIDRFSKSSHLKNSYSIALLCKGNVQFQRIKTELKYS